VGGEEEEFEQKGTKITKESKNPAFAAPAKDA
jgi:hypothetical protein